MWDDYNRVVVWAFFGIAFLWDWNENWPLPVLWPLLSFPTLLAYWVQHFHSIRIWNSSTGIPSPPLALFVVMLPKAHLTSHSRMEVMVSQYCQFLKCHWVVPFKMAKLWEKIIKSVHHWWHCKRVQQLWEMVWIFLKKLKLELLYEPITPLLYMYAKQLKAGSQKDICTPLFIVALVTIAMRWKQPKCSSLDERQTECGFYPHN